MCSQFCSSFKKTGNDLTVTHTDRPFGIFGDLLTVRHQNNGDPFSIEFTEHFHNFNAGNGVKVSGRLIGKNHRRVVYQCPGDRHPLLLSA